MWKIIFTATALLTLSSATIVIDLQSGLRENDLIEWSGVISNEPRAAKLYILSPYNATTPYSVMKMEIQGFRNHLAFSAGIVGHELERRPKAFCSLGKVQVAPEKEFRAIIRISRSSIIVYWNGDLVFTMSLTSSHQRISRARKIVIQGSAKTEIFKLLTDENLADEMQEPECGTITQGIDVPSFCPAPESCRIAGGGPANPGQQPWQAAIRRKYSEGEAGLHECGATLIGGCWAVTAAHCFQSTRNLERYVVRVGDYYNRDNETNSWNPTIESQQDIEIETVIKHYNFGTYPSSMNDIALIKLKKCVTYNNFVKPACLPRSKEQFSSPNSMCGVSGWGASDASQGPSEYPACLQTSMVRMQDSSSCKNTYKRLFDPRSMVCATGVGCADTCLGDSGGPLMCITGRRLKFTLWGITSWGVECGQESHPGVYTKVSNYIRWMYLSTKLTPHNSTVRNILRSRNLDEYNCVRQSEESSK